MSKQEKCPLCGAGHGWRYTKVCGTVVMIHGGQVVNIGRLCLERQLAAEKAQHGALRLAYAALEHNAEANNAELIRQLAAEKARRERAETACRAIFQCPREMRGDGSCNVTLLPEVVTIVRAVIAQKETP